MIFMSSVWSASMSVCSVAYEAELFAFSFNKILTKNLHEVLLTSWSEGAYYVDQDDLPHLHLENLQVHHLTRIRIHYNHMALEILWSLKSGPDATFWERDEWDGNWVTVARLTIHACLQRAKQKHDETSPSSLVVTSKHQHWLDIICPNKRVSFTFCIRI